MGHHAQTKKLLITGATGGMGRASALLAASQGYDLVLADLSLEKLESLAAQCQDCGVAASASALDVTQSASIASLVRTLDEAGGVDAIIHTVGLSPQMADWRRIIDVDLVGTVALLEQTRPFLKVGGCTVAIASMSAYMVPPQEQIDQTFANPLSADFHTRLEALNAAGHALTHSGMAYSYSKRALKQYVADHSPDWGKEGKRLVSISPGLIDTEMGRLENAAMDDFDAMRSLIALTRLGEPEDIAHTALFLVSDAAAYITGVDLLVDGGFVANLLRQQRQAT